MTKQSSIEWLIDQVEDFMGLIPVDIIQQAKQMHKEEIEDAYTDGCSQGVRSTNNFYYNKLITSEQYYQETYGGDQ